MSGVRKWQMQIDSSDEVADAGGLDQEDTDRSDEEEAILDSVAIAKSDMGDLDNEVWEAHVSEKRYTVVY